MLLILVSILPLTCALPFHGYFDPKVGYYQLVKCTNGNYEWRAIYFPQVEQELPSIDSLLDEKDLADDSESDLASLGQVLDFGLSSEPVLDEANAIKAGNVIDVMIENGNFKNFLQIIEHFNLASELKSKPQLTIFAPDDNVFAKRFGLIMSETDLKRHLIAVTLPSKSIESGPAFTLSGEIVNLLKTDDSKVQIQFGNNQVNVVQADILASNGVVHVIDQIISE